VLDSRGGDLDATLEIGRMIRSKGLVTIVGTSEVLGCEPRDKVCNKNRPATQPYTVFTYSPGDCSGACLFVLAAGTQRAGYWISGAELPPPEFFPTRSEAGAAKLI